MALLIVGSIDIYKKGISGGHLNPSVTLTQLILKNISLGLGITYIIVQTLGAFLGNAFSYIITDKHATPVLTFDKTFPWNVVMSEFIAVINFAYKF